MPDTLMHDSSARPFAPSRAGLTQSSADKNEGLINLADAAMTAFRDWRTTGAESHRTYALVSADPELKTGIDYCTKRICMTPTPTAESKRYAELRNIWTNIVYDRHGYKAASTAWNKAGRRFRKAAKALFAAPAQSSDDVLLKIGMYQAWLSDIARAETGTAADEALWEYRDWLLTGINEDLKRLKKTC